MCNCYTFLFNNIDSTIHHDDIILINGHSGSCLARILITRSYYFPEDHPLRLQKRVSGTGGVEPSHTGLIYIQVMGAEQRADMTWHGSWFHQWGLAGPPPQPWDPGVKTLCSVSGMKAAGETCDFGLCLNSWVLGFTFKGSAGGELITWGNGWIHVEVKKNKKPKTKQYPCTRSQISTFPDIWLSCTMSFFYLKIYLETGAPPLAELPGRSTQFPLCNIWFTWTIISACHMTCSSKRSVMWLCQMRVVRKAERSTCLELD